MFLSSRRTTFFWKDIFKMISASFFFSLVTLFDYFFPKQYEQSKVTSRKNNRSFWHHIPERKVNKKQTGPMTSLCKSGLLSTSHEGKWLMSTLEKTLWMLGQVSQSHRKARTWQWFWERIYSFDEYDVPASAGGNFRSACQQIRRFSFYIFSAKGLRYKQYLLYSVNFNFLESESL